MDLSVSKYVRFIGHVLHENIRKYYAIADIYVTLQDISCLSASLLEAMICGDCIIALNTGDTRQVIKNNQNGILLNYSELNSLPSVLLELLNNEKYRRMLANNAKKFAINKVWTWEKRADAEIKLVERLIQESS